jgi:hypothetical protein
MLPVLLSCLLLPAPADLPALPPVSTGDLRWFPPAAVVSANVELASRHVAWLRQRQEAWPENDRTWLEEALHALAVWRTLERAQLCTDGDPDWTAGRLLELRDYLGPEDYFFGRMPAVVPLHRFRWLDRVSPDRVPVGKPL